METETRSQTRRLVAWAYTDAAGSAMVAKLDCGHIEPHDGRSSIWAQCGQCPPLLGPSPIRCGCGTVLAVRGMAHDCKWGND